MTIRSTLCLISLIWLTGFTFTLWLMVITNQRPTPSIVVSVIWPVYWTVVVGLLVGIILCLVLGTVEYIVERLSRPSPTLGE